MGDNEQAMDTGSEDRGAVDAALVARVRGGDPDAFGELYDRWFDRVHDVAFRITRDHAAAADVAQDAFLAAWRQLAGLERAEVFGGWLLRIARNRALDQVRRDARSTPGDPETMARIERTAPPSSGAPAGFRVEDRVAAADDPARAAEDDEIAELVWGAAEALGARDSEVLDLTLRHGMTPADIAEVIGTNRNAANQMVHRARTHLKDAVCARVLWRRGRPECGDLADALADAGVNGFGAAAVRVATEHAATCDLCTQRRALRLDPTRVFAAIPVVAAPALLKQRTAHALMADGVPVGRSRALADRDGSDDRGDDGHGQDGDDGHDPPRHRRARRVGVVLAAAIVVLVIVLAAVVVLADRLDHGTVDDRTLSARARPATTGVTSTSTTTPTTTTTSATTTTGAAPTSTTAPVPPAATGPDTRVPVVDPTAPPRVEDPAPPPDPTDPPARPASVALRLAPDRRPLVYPRPDAPVLSWSSDGAATVEVSGPGVSATGLSGSVAVCPTASGEQWTSCLADPPATYTYTAVARDGGGAVVASATTTLTVG